MAQSGYTPIQLYYSTTASNAPSAGNLSNGELALNIASTDMSVYLKNSSGNVKKLFSNPATLVYPTVDGTNGQVLRTDGSGNLSWTTVVSTPGGSNTQIQFNNSGSFGGSANFTWDGSNVQIGSQGDLRLGDSDNSNWVAFQAPATVTSNVTWTLPSADGSASQVLTTNGSGTLSWSTPSAGISQAKVTGINFIYGL